MHDYVCTSAWLVLWLMPSLHWIYPPKKLCLFIVLMNCSSSSRADELPLVAQCKDVLELPNSSSGCWQAPGWAETNAPTYIPTQLQHQQWLPALKYKHLWLTVFWTKWSIAKILQKWKFWNLRQKDNINMNFFANQTQNFKNVRFLRKSSKTVFSRKTYIL